MTEWHNPDADRRCVSILDGGMHTFWPALAISEYGTARCGQARNVRKMKPLALLFQVVHAVIALLLASAALLLVVISARVGLASIAGGLGMVAAQGVIEAIGQTITEEEVIHPVRISGAARIRRYLSRFMVVIVIALAVEGLVAAFKALHENMEQLPHAASLVFAVGVILAGWAMFLRLGGGVEEGGRDAGKQGFDEDR